MKHFLNTQDWSRAELDALLAQAAAFKRNRFGDALKGRSIALVFFNPSLRTRTSFELGAFQLGGHAVVLQPGKDAVSNRRAAETWLERALQPPAGTPTPKLLMLPEIWNAPYAAASFGDYAEPVPEPGGLLTEGPSPSLAMVARLWVVRGEWERVEGFDPQAL